METISVVSSILNSLQYDEKTYILKVIFKNGKEYVYENIPYDTWQAFKNSESKGSFFSKFIKGKYSTNKG